MYHWLFKIIVDICDFINLDIKFADSFFRQTLTTCTILIGYRILREFKIEQTNSIFSAFGLFLISEFGWALQFNYTHTVLATTATLLFTLQFIRLIKRPILFNYCLVGLSFIFPILSKYNTILTIGGMILASLTIKSARSIIISSKFLLILSIVTIGFLPHFNWLISSTKPLLTVSKILARDHVDSLLPMLSISMSVLLLFLAQTLPLLITLIISFGMEYNWIKLIIVENDIHSLLGRSYIITIVIYFIFVILADARVVHIHWLLPAVLSLPLALPLAACRIGKLNKYSKSIFFSAVIVKIILFSVLTIMDFWQLH